MLRITVMRRAILSLSLFLSAAAFAQGQPDLVVQLSTEGVIVPALPAAIEVHFFNQSSAVPATATVLTLTSTVSFVDVPGECTATGNQATCNVGTVTFTRGMIFTIRAPDASREPFSVTAEISSPLGDSVPSNNTSTLRLTTERTFFVTTTADSGPGSLRDAIHTANVFCAVQSCLIGFRIPKTTAPWVTIVTESPLPPVANALNLVIDGSTQTRFFGDTNPAGPEVELTGVANRDGDGLAYRGCGFFRLSHLAINGFPGSGVYLTSFFECRTAAGAEVSDNYIGTDPTGVRAVRNQRGVYVDGVPFTAITGNTISGNLRSGVYVQKGQVRVQNNRIAGNGASGVYIGPNGAGSDVSDNSIGFNAHWGIAIGTGAPEVSATGNSLQGNFGLGIDWGHDMNAANGPVPAPQITSVRVENGRTIIEGFTAPRGVVTSEVHLYANDAPHWTGYGEGQEPLGFVTVAETAFSMTIDRDLRGKWITATFTRRNPVGFARSPGNHDLNGFFSSITSEFSRAVLVQ